MTKSFLEHSSYSSLLNERIEELVKSDLTILVRVQFGEVLLEFIFIQFLFELLHHLAGEMFDLILAKDAIAVGIDFLEKNLGKFSEVLYGDGHLC